MPYYAKKARKIGAKRRNRKPKVSFEKRVLKVVRRTREIKTKTFKFSQFTLGNPVTGNFVSEILGQIRQGDSSDERVGNSINLLSCELRGIINYQQPGSTPPVAAFVRLMILRQKNINSANDIVLDPTLFKSNQLLENDSAYVGSVLDHLTKINKDAFTSKKQIKMRIINNTNYQGNSDAVGALNSKFYQYTMRFGQGKKINYDEDISNSANNFPYFFLPVACKQDSTSIAADLLTDYTWTIRYTDA